MIEAMAWSPIVSTDVEGMGALVRSDNGLLCPVGDIDAMTDAVRRLERDKVDDSARRRRNALAEAEFSKDVMCRNLGALLGQLTGAAA